MFESGGSSRPYVSFVVASRNDDYGGDLLGRMGNFITCLLDQWGRHGLDAELVVVEWNPPAQEKRLWQELPWPQRHDLGAVRFIEVPDDLHGRFENADRMPVFEYIAKNVGIRRARGEFVLATNPDILFSEELMSFLAGRRLSAGAFYRVNRYDVAGGIPSGTSTQQKLEYCRRNAVRVLAQSGGYPARTYHVRSAYRVALSASKSYIKSALTGKRRTRYLFGHAAGDFTLMASAHWNALQGYPPLASSACIDS